MKRNEKVEKLLFYMYMLFLVKVILLKLPLRSTWMLLETWNIDRLREGITAANLIPFKTVKMYIRYSYMLNSFENLAGNILIFVPFGLIVPELYEKFRPVLRIALLSAGTVIAFETIQMITGLGVFDVDDVVLNLTGCFAGYFVWRLIQIYPGKSEKDSGIEKDC